MSHNNSEIINKINSTILPEIGSHWIHYKGEIYVIINIGIRESNEDFEIIYNSLNNPLKYPWIRPLKEWNQKIIYNKQQVRRFSLYNN